MSATRLQREKRTVELMIRLYCRQTHARELGDGSAPSTGRGTGAGRRSRSELCPACAALLDYSGARVDACRFGAEKPVCARCPVHCFRPDRREQIRAVMRYAGPRMTWRHPYLAVRHLFDRRRAAR